MVPSPAEQAAEVKRLTEEIIMRAQRNAWKGVDDQYSILESKGDEAFNLIPKERAAGIHLKGASASDSLGKIKDKQTRLWRAKESMDNAGVPDTNDTYRTTMNSLAEIDKAYGSVHIAPRTEPTSERERKRLQGRGPELTRVRQTVEQSFPIEGPRSIEFTAQKIRETGYFTGLLPTGSYRLADQSFTVNAGTELIGKKRTNVFWGN